MTWLSSERVKPVITSLRNQTYTPDQWSYLLLYAAKMDFYQLHDNLPHILTAIHPDPTSSQVSATNWDCAIPESSKLYHLRIDPVTDSTEYALNNGPVNCIVWYPKSKLKICHNAETQWLQKYLSDSKMPEVSFWYTLHNYTKPAALGQFISILTNLSDNGITYP